jgi:uncharacterized membrane protein required for colicin V production
MTFGVFGAMFGNVTGVSIIGTYVLCEMKALELSQSEAWFMKERVHVT